MKINFVGNFISGYTGEKADECHLADEMEALGHEVRRLPRDEWREHVVSGNQYPNIPVDLKADINIIAKWNGFYDGRFARALGSRSGSPVFYWVWDYMQGEDWHMNMVQASDLYIANDVFSGHYGSMSNCYYFPFDVSSKEFDRKFHNQGFNVSFFGSWIAQGHRQEWLKIINKEVPVTIFSWNYKDWPEEFKNRFPAVYGDAFSTAVSQTKICLGFSVHPSTWGYWSNRTGKTLTVGGFLLQEYAPGMELFFRDGIDYFSSPQEAVEKIKYYLINEEERESIALKGYQIGRERFTSYERVKDLMILAERFIKRGDTVWSL